MSTHIARFFFSVSLLFFAPSTTLAQQPNQPIKGNNTISGHVSVEGNDAANVTVVLKKGVADLSNRDDVGKVIAKTKTNLQGNYQLLNLPPGKYILSPQATAHVIDNSEEGPLMYGAQGKTLMLKENDNVEKMDFTLTRGGVITGRVTNSEDKPVIGQRVELIRLNKEGKREPFRSTNYWSGQTDDRGIYRYYGLPQGRYMVMVGVDPKNGRMNFGRRTFYPLTYHPNVQNESEASIIEVGPGDEVGDVDIRVGPRSFAYQISGRVVTEDDNQPVQGAYVRLSFIKDNNKTSSPSFINNVATDARGEFKVQGVMAGRYKLGLSFFNKSALVGSEPIVEIKDADVENVIIKAGRGQSISGTVTFENTSTQPAPVKIEQLEITAYGESQEGMPSQSTARVAPDGSFIITGLKEGKVGFAISRNNTKGLHLIRV